MIISCVDSYNIPVYQQSEYDGDLVEYGYENEQLDCYFNCGKNGNPSVDCQTCLCSPGFYGKHCEKSTFNLGLTELWLAGPAWLLYL